METDEMVQPTFEVPGYWKNTLLVVVRSTSTGEYANSICRTRESVNTTVCLQAAASFQRHSRLGGD